MSDDKLLEAELRAMANEIRPKPEPDYEHVMNDARVTILAAAWALIIIGIVIATIFSFVGCATRYAPDDTSIFGKTPFLNQVREGDYSECGTQCAEQVRKP